MSDRRIAPLPRPPVKPRSAAVVPSFLTVRCRMVTRPSKTGRILGFSRHSGTKFFCCGRGCLVPLTVADVTLSEKVLWFP